MFDPNPGPLTVGHPRTTRRVVALVATATVGVVLAFTPTTTALAGSATCFGKTPTITGDGYVRGTRGADVIRAGAGSEVHALGGDDLICGSGLVYAGAGHDKVFYRGAGPTELNGGPGRDRLFYLGGGLGELNGNRGDDHVRSGPGEQFVNGGPGDDDIGLGKGEDYANGKAGDDRIEGGPGRDSASGGSGRDTCAHVEDRSGCEA